MTIPFTQNVRVRSLLLKTARGEEAPTVVRLYANKPDGAQPPAFFQRVSRALAASRRRLTLSHPCLSLPAAGITFSDAQPHPSGLKPSQEISLEPGAYHTAHGDGVVEYPLKVHVFKDVVSLSLFFGDSPGEEKSRI